MTDEVELAVMRACGRLEAETIVDARRTILEQHSSSFKWLNASLLAINGGGAVSILSLENLANGSKLFPCSAFLVGVLFALLSARLNQGISIKGLAPLQKQLGYWTQVSITGVRNESFEEQLTQEAKKVIRWAWLGQGCGWLSAGAFVFGSIFVGVGLS